MPRRYMHLFRRLGLPALMVMLFVISPMRGLVAQDSAAAGGHAGMKMDMPGMQDSMAGMTGPLGVSVDRMGSGTTWMPEATPLPYYRQMMGSWSVMGHGFVFLNYNHQGGARGDSHFGSTNWIMVMASRDLGGGRLQFRTMLSAEPWTVGGRGYPLLLQSGETYQGVPIHDRQHPHDLFMELGVLYERAVARDLGIALYVAPSGEPASGPVAFMHRPSAQSDPLAGIGHHWQDATHITFGVVTAGVFGRRWKLEGSVFNGREPDEKRWNFDLRPLDSYAGRLTVVPNSHWTLTASYAFVKSPEAQDSTQSVRRITASVLHGRSIGQHGAWSTAFVWGANLHATGGLAHSALVETNLNLDGHNTVFGRIEMVDKSATDLVLPAFPVDTRFRVGTGTVGYVREVRAIGPTSLGLGFAASASLVPQVLTVAYGTRTLTSLLGYLRLRPQG